MKKHERAKVTREQWRKQARAGKINAADGTWIPRPMTSTNSMMRDYAPQRQGE